MQALDRDSGAVLDRLADPFTVALSAGGRRPGNDKSGHASL